MKIKLKKLRDQTIVITGASSGIGLATARMAAQKGAKLVLAARSDGALRTLTEEIRQKGGQAIYFEADVGNPDDVREIARAAIERYGGFDTWVNNAGIGMYGKLEDVDVEAMRKLFETNFWGLLYGSLQAVEHLKRRGGALINVGSTVSERGVPLQGIYTASKHAVKGFTDVLRMELEADDAPVSVTLIKPAAIDTPFPLNAKNYLANEPQHVAPVYAPEAVAEAILHCAETPVRDLFVGAGGKANAVIGYYAPRLADKVGEQYGMAGTDSGEPRRETDALDEPSEKLEERGHYPGHVAQSSFYTKSSLHPWLSGAAALSAGLLLRAWWRAIRAEQRSEGLHWANPYEPKPKTTQARSEAMIEKSQVREHMQVRGSDGQPVGEVDKLEGDRIELTKDNVSAKDQHHYIEVDAVASVEGDVLRLDKSAEAAKREMQARESECGANRPADI
jgi:short-subunit dehydrogenase